MGDMKSLNLSLGSPRRPRRGPQALEEGVVLGWHSLSPAVSSLCADLSPGPLFIFGSLGVCGPQGGYVGQAPAPWGGGKRGGGMDEGQEPQD